MRALLVTVLAVLGLAVPASAQAACSSEGYETHALTSGTAVVGPANPTTRDTIELSVVRQEDFAKPGSTVFTITGPSGTVKKPAAPRQGDPESYARLTDREPGHYTFTVSWQVPMCNDAVDPAYTTATTGPKAFDIAAPSRRPTVSWRGYPAVGGIAKGAEQVQRAGVSGFIQCGPDEQAIDEPITFRIRYELGSRTPTESSPGASRSYRCPLKSRAPSRTNRSWGTLGFDSYGGGFGVVQGHSARALLEVFSGSHPIDAIRFRIRPKSGSLTMVPDSGPCPVACARHWTPTHR